MHNILIRLENVPCVEIVCLSTFVWFGGGLVLVFFFLFVFLLQPKFKFVNRTSIYIYCETGLSTSFIFKSFYAKGQANITMHT